VNGTGSVFTKRNMPPVGKICSKADELKVIIEDKADFEWAEKYRKMVGKRCRSSATRVEQV